MYFQKRARQRLRLVLAIAVGLLGLSPAASNAGVDDYPAPWRAPTAQDSAVDSWGYYNRECTSFVAWRLSSRNGFEMPRAIGDASNWGYWASSNGYAVNSTPAVGSVAWSSSEGHVAWVEAVNSNGTVTIEEYNYGSRGNYGRRTVSAGSFRYIHFKDIPSSSPPTPNGGSRVVGWGNRCLDVPMGSVANGTQLNIWDCQGSPNQQWIFNDGLLQVYGNYTKCLDVYLARTANGTPVVTWECQRSANQLWQPYGDSTFRSVHSGKCLDIANGGTSNGSKLVVWDCHGGPNQRWSGIPIPNGGNRIQGVGSGRCLDVPFASISPGMQLNLWDCQGGANQQWVAEGSQIRVYGDKCLDAANGGTANGTPVVIWYCQGSPNQQWTLATDGTIRSNQSGKCLDAANGDTGNGTKLVIWDCHGGANQQWWQLP